MRVSSTLRTEARKERSQLKTKLTVMAQEMKHTEKALHAIEALLGIDSGPVASALPKAAKPAQSNGLPYGKRTVVMPRFEGQRWICCLLGKLKSAAYASSVAKLGRTHMPMCLRPLNLDEKQLHSRVSALLFHSEKRGLVTIDHDHKPNLYGLTAKGRKVYTDNEKYIRKLMA